MVLLFDELVADVVVVLVVDELVVALVVVLSVLVLCPILTPVLAKASFGRPLLIQLSNGVALGFSDSVQVPHRPHNATLHHRSTS